MDCFLSDGCAVGCAFFTPDCAAVLDLTAVLLSVGCLCPLSRELLFSESIVITSAVLQNVG